MCYKKLKDLIDVHRQLVEQIFCNKSSSTALPLQDKNVHPSKKGKSWDHHS